jgi:hypothetical protein
LTDVISFISLLNSESLESLGKDYACNQKQEGHLKKERRVWSFGFGEPVEGKAD